MSDSLHDVILDKFKHRCLFPIYVNDDGTALLCYKLTNVVHEIVPKSRLRNWNVPENRIPLCAEHHELVHKFGYKRYENELKKAWEQTVNDWTISFTS